MKLPEILAKIKAERAHSAHPAPVGELDPQGAALIEALGGRANIKDIEACLTRLRVKVDHISAIQTDKIQQLGALGVIIIDHEVQAIFGRSSDKLKSELKIWLDSSNSNNP
ncbi:PTS transporter subunit EIIB [Celerinatantimonas sp. YJH-8]|uniref:PTS transporter subunit EIIB n=1 Tax=Celerinatantimonas sp. YJH-8 TaxID=3228714 RepID=UPI0038C239A1